MRDSTAAEAPAQRPEASPRSVGDQFRKTDIHMIAAVPLCPVEPGVSTSEDRLEVSRVGLLELGDTCTDRHDRSHAGCGMRNAQREDALAYPLGGGSGVFHVLLR